METVKNDADMLSFQTTNLVSSLLAYPYTSRMAPGGIWVFLVTRLPVGLICLVTAPVLATTMTLNNMDSPPFDIGLSFIIHYKKVPRLKSGAYVKRRIVVN